MFHVLTARQVTYQMKIITKAFFSITLLGRELNMLSTVDMKSGDSDQVVELVAVISVFFFKWCCWNVLSNSGFLVDEEPAA
ncbi:hypothetical protein AB6A40_006410 [Gnathostoma spinigerum]|uniref:Uncharacterized protein n=1 Tax=Gnathostoma spinigerum TaxID=75299 RepID=A0ABD6EIY2_9BILA